MVYGAQREGRELSQADQAELEILEIARPASLPRKGQGFGLSAAERKAVELRAMDVADNWLREEGYLTKNTAATKPYDIFAKKRDEELFVEVKGTTSDIGDAIAMTHGEVALYRRERGRTALLIVKSIRLRKGLEHPIAVEGELESFVGWNIDDWLIEPTAFRVSRSK